MASPTRNEYLSLRRAYEPDCAKLIIIAESPPASGRFFYNPEGAITEPLFAALMKQLNLSVTAKGPGLREFQRLGWVLVDATYEPVNRLSGPDRDNVIARDYPHLCDDLGRLTGGRPTPVVLLKANVCRILEPRLVADGFNVINRGRVVSFPSTGQQTKFHEQFGAILNGTERRVVVS
jgi:hypothetical protein